MKANKTMAVSLCLMMSALALAPVGDAHLTRSFIVTEYQKFDFGTGWGYFNADETGDKCLVGQGAGLLGLRIIVPLLFYYEYGRVTHNDHEDWSDIHSDDGTIPDPAVDCLAFNETKPITGGAISQESGYNVHTSDLNRSRQVALTAGLTGCTFDPDVDSCELDSAKTFLNLFACPADEATFAVDITNRPFEEQVIFANTGVAVFSTSIGCNVASTNSLNQTDLLDFSGAADGDAETAFEDTPAHEAVPIGSGDNYVVTCFYGHLSDRKDADGNSLGAADIVAHDYLLVLDVDDTSTWTASVQTHLANDLQGMPDLTGKNGCPFALL